MRSIFRTSVSRFIFYMCLLGMREGGRLKSLWTIYGILASLSYVFFCGTDREVFFYVWKLKETVHWFLKFNIYCASYYMKTFYETSNSRKQLWFEIVKKIGCSKSVWSNIVIYIIYITRTDFEHHFSQLFWVRVVLSRWNFHKKCFS